MKRVILRLTMALAIIAMPTACSKSKEDIQKIPEEKKIIRVRVKLIEPRTFLQKLTLTASAKASREVTISSEAAGRVVKIGFEKGDSVTKGQPLVWLDDSQLQTEITSSRANRDLLELDYRKLKALADRNAGVSEFQLEQSRLRLEVAEAGLKSLMVRLGKLTIKAPFAGRLSSRKTEVGAIVSPGLALARLVTIRPIKVVTGVPETAIADFEIRKKATIVFDAYPDKIYEGAVTYIAPEVNKVTRVFECEITLPNRKRTIRPEMSAKVTFTRKEMPDSILIPQTAVLELSDGHAVFLVDDKGVARQKRVTIKDNANEMALISSGIVKGDKLVIVGQRSLIDGDKVEIVEK